MLLTDGAAEMKADISLLPDDKFQSAAACLRQPVASIKFGVCPVDVSAATSLPEGDGRDWASALTLFCVSGENGRRNAASRSVGGGGGVSVAVCGGVNPAAACRCASKQQKVKNRQATSKQTRGFQRRPPL